MPVQATYDVVNVPPRVADCRFELVARRLAEAWLAQGAIDASPDVLTIAAEFLARRGVVARLLPGGEVRLDGEPGRSLVVSREMAVTIAFRHLAAQDAGPSSGTVTQRAA